MGVVKVDGGMEMKGSTNISTRLAKRIFEKVQPKGKNQNTQTMPPEM